MRVSGTQVLLDLVVHAYYQGETPEHIVPRSSLIRCISAKAIT